MAFCRPRLPDSTFKATALTEGALAKDQKSKLRSLIEDFQETHREQINRRVQRAKLAQIEGELELGQAAKWTQGSEAKMISQQPPIPASKWSKYIWDYLHAHYDAYCELAGEKITQEFVDGVLEFVIQPEMHSLLDTLQLDPRVKNLPDIYRGAYMDQVGRATARVYSDIKLKTAIDLEKAPPMEGSEAGTAVEVKNFEGDRVRPEPKSKE